MKIECKEIQKDQFLVTVINEEGNVVSSVVEKSVVRAMIGDLDNAIT